MKQYTDESQTAKLIELGFDKPSSIASVEPIYGMGGISVAKAYTIGELIEMLPSFLDNHKQLCIESSGGKWWVAYINLWDKKYFVRKDDLIDALYEMILQLKEDGVI